MLLVNKTFLEVTGPALGAPCWTSHVQEEAVDQALEVEAVEHEERGKVQERDRIP